MTDWRFGRCHTVSVREVVTPSANLAWAEAWQRSWDRLEELYVPERERQISALVDTVEAVCPAAPTVIDLGCGPGTVSRRLLERVPSARSVAVDIDPALLTIASATFGDDKRVQIVPADLRDPEWTRCLPEPEADAVLTATALHWLPEDAVGSLYRAASRVARRSLDQRGVRGGFGDMEVEQRRGGGRPPVRARSVASVLER